MALNSPSTINEKKRRIEIAFISELKSIFRNIANDVESLYVANGRIDAENIAENYSIEFTKVIRDIYRRTIKEFGFELRKDIESKHNFLFDVEYKKTLIDLDVKQSIIVLDEDLEEKEEGINAAFLAASAFFISNESEDRSKLISETNAKEINLAVEQENIKFNNMINEQQQRINNLQLQDASDRQINAAINQLEQSNRNRNSIVAKNIKQNLLDRSDARSNLISENEVGLAESWARQTEAELIDDAALINQQGNFISINKTWNAILDSKTRDDHVLADGQTVNINESFFVDGESLKFPRDPNGSPRNVINCRCVSSNSVGSESKSIYGLDKKAIDKIDLKPTLAMSKEAKKGLDWRKEFNRGGTAVGIARARDLVNRKNLSPKTIGRMVSYFARHEVDKEAEGFRSGEEGYPSNGRIAWSLWGGDAGQAWSKRKWEKIKKERDD